jgi:hypothetical protein
MFKKYENWWDWKLPRIIYLRLSLFGYNITSYIHKKDSKWLTKTKRMTNYTARVFL